MLLVFQPVMYLLLGIGPFSNLHIWDGSDINPARWSAAGWRIYFLTTSYDRWQVCNKDRDRHIYVLPKHNKWKQIFVQAQKSILNKNKAPDRRGLLSAYPYQYTWVVVDNNEYVNYTFYFTCSFFIIIIANPWVNYH